MVEDHLLPKHNIETLVRSVIPGQFTASFINSLQDAAHEFVSIVFAEARDNVIKEERKQIYAEDILEALDRLGITQYNQVLKLFITKYREALFNSS
jgi:nuclear transcription Y subunit beta